MMSGVRASERVKCVQGWGFGEETPLTVLRVVFVGSSPDEGNPPNTSVTTWVRHESGLSHWRNRGGDEEPQRPRNDVKSRENLGVTIS